MINVNVNVKKHHLCQKDYVWNLAICSCGNEKYLASVMDDSAIICDEVRDADAEAESNDRETKTVPINFDEKKSTCKIQNFYILFAFLLITRALVVAVNIYCDLIKYQAKQKHLPFQFTNTELKEVIYQKHKSKMSNKVKNIDIKNRAYYFFNDMIKIKSFNLNNFKTDETHTKIFLFAILDM